MHWQTSYLAGSQKAAEMARCLLVIQHNGRVCEHTCVCVCVWYVWVAACVYLWLNLLLSSGGFLCFLHVFPQVFAYLCVFCLIAVLRLFLECLSLFVVEATFLSKSKLSWHNCLWTVQKKCVLVCFEFLCVCLCCICVCVCVCPWETAIKGAVWCRDCMKGVREETEWQAAERAACGGGQGADAGA